MNEKNEADGNQMPCSPNRTTARVPGDGASQGDRLTADQLDVVAKLLSTVSPAGRLPPKPAPRPFPCG